jgi:hypothetical protein
MKSHPLLRKLARKITQGNTPAQTPRPPQLQVHHLTVTNVDNFSGVVGAQFPDPSAPVVQNLRVIQPYSSDNPPSVGDTAVVHDYGGTFYVIGELVVPTNFITV